ncbi:MAG: histidine phosphatase family protein [Woeseiaceae bacterium]|nr:histidine phosphatase family protein [Woeseiaceae bacterium]
MKTLTIVRHAKSSWKTAGLADRERPLNNRGEQDAPLMGAVLAGSEVRPSLLISSPAVRAWTTARLIAAEIGYPREFLQREDDLYLADVGDILRVLARQDPGFNSIMMFGHNPGLTSFANRLVPGLTSNVPTCGIVAVELNTDDWNLDPLPECRLLFYDTPKNHRDKH